MAIQLPTQPSDRLNVPAPMFPDSCPTAVRVMPFPAPTDCNLPSGSTCPLPPLLKILPSVMTAGKVPVCEQPALVNVHAPSKPPRPSSVGRSASSFRGPDNDLSSLLMLPPVEPDCANAAEGIAALQTETLPTARMFRYDAIGKAAEDSDLFETVTRTGG